MRRLTIESGDQHINSAKVEKYDYGSNENRSHSDAPMFSRCSLRANITNISHNTTSTKSVLPSLSIPDDHDDEDDVDDDEHDGDYDGDDVEFWTLYFSCSKSTRAKYHHMMTMMRITTMVLMMVLIEMMPKIAAYVLVSEIKLSNDWSNDDDDTDGGGDDDVDGDDVAHCTLDVYSCSKLTRRIVDDMLMMMMMVMMAMMVVVMVMMMRASGGDDDVDGNDDADCGGDDDVIPWIGQ